MTIEKKLLGTNPVSGEVLPEGVSFDGHLGNSATDYLLRTTPLTGQADSKTFTVSTFIYWQENTSATLFYLGNNNFNCFLANGGSRVSITAKNASGTTVLRFEAPTTDIVPRNTWVNVQMSFDLSDTSKRHIYVNGVDITAACFAGSYPVYVNDNIDFTPAAGSGNADTSYRIGASYSAQAKFGGRLAHLFLDYTYRDLSVTANRRLFIDADGKPSDTIPSSPIIYLPMTDAATAGSNSGTGGDFTAVGTLATAERGPNQDNCSASTFDGSNDYMTRASIGASNSKVFTVSGTINVTGGDGLVCKFYKNGHGTLFQITTNIYGSLYIKAYNASYQNRFYVQWKNSIGANNALMPNRNYHFSLSVDMSDTSKRHLIINGAAVSPTYTYYTDVEMGFSAIDLSRVGFVSGDGYFAGDLGELYFNTAYTDLSTSNPFWDSDANRPNSVRKVIADTSVTPLVALPLMGNDAGNNLGSGGDFTVNSGPYTGARGGSEFWARSIQGSGGATLDNTSYVAPSTKTFTFAMAGKRSAEQNLSIISSGANTGASQFKMEYESSRKSYKLQAANSSGVRKLLVELGYNTSPNTNQWDIILMSVDMADTSKRHIYINGVSKAGDWSNYVNESLDFSKGAFRLWGDAGHQTGFFYLSSTYTDFSQEANRNKFIDQLGYPKDLGADGSEPTGNSPLIYMKFNSNSVGTNNGTGGNFSAVGSIGSGADVDP